MDNPELHTWNYIERLYAQVHGLCKQDIGRLDLARPFLDGHASRIDAARIQKYIDHLLGQGMAPSTVNRYLVPIKVALKLAHRHKVITEVPYIPTLKEPPAKTRWLTHEEAQRLIDALPKHLSDAAVVGLMTGLREANITGLRWENVDLTRATAWVDGSQTKNRQNLAVPLPVEALAVLTRRWREAGKPKAGPVFTVHGHRLHRMSTPAWYAATKKIGLDGVTPHTLRHTWASWHVMAGTDPLTLMQLGGWKSVKMVQRYTHLSSDHLADAAKRIAL